MSITRTSGRSRVRVSSSGRRGARHTNRRGGGGGTIADNGRVRARQGGREVTLYTGSEHRLWRQPYYEGNRMYFKRWDGVSVGSDKMLDSIVHRYGREVGFRGADGEAPEEMDDRARASALQNAALVYKPKSTAGRAGAQCQLECYVLNHNSGSRYAQFLRELIGELPSVGPIGPAAVATQFMHTRQLMQPPVSLLESLMRHMRDGDVDETAAAAPNDGVEAVAGRMNKGNSIDTRMKSLSGVMMEFGQKAIVRSPAMKTLLEEWTAEDDLAQAESFDLEKVLPLLWEALWNNNKMGLKKKVATWARLLVQLSVIGRSSDVTGNYCPRNESVKYPSTSVGYMPDGTPLWIQVDWMMWKGRKKGKKGKYPMKIHANPKNTRYCPVHWLLEHWNMRTDLSGAKDEKAPILDELKSEAWRNTLKNLFGLCGLTCFSSHSLRRSAAMWASRCGATLYVIKNVGRWETVEQMLLYVAEGKMMVLQAMKENGGVDPVWEFWSFSIDTMVGTLECDGKLMEALMQEI